MKKLFGFIFSLVFFVIVAVGAVGVGGYMYVKNTYGIDILKTAKALKTLQEPTNEAELCPNAYSAADMVDVMETVNASVKDFITYTEEDGYTINFDGEISTLTDVIKLTDKQVCAVAQEVVEQEIEGKVDFGGEKVNVALKQVDFYDISGPSVYFNVVISVDMTPLKKVSDNHIIQYITSLVPDTMYVSSTVLVTHDGTPFSYDVKHEALKINNLTAEDTEELFRALGVIFKVDPVETWNVYVGTTIMNALVGNEENKGLAYGLSGVGATDYAFEAVDGEDYFVVKRG